MHVRRLSFLVLFVTAFFCFIKMGYAQGRTARPPDTCAGTGSKGDVLVHAPQRGASPLSLCDGLGLSSYSAAGTAVRASQAEPLALATGDFDQDGTPDLVSGFGGGMGAFVTVHRGNVYALWPYGIDLHNGPPAAFLPNPRSFSVPEAPDFVATGDFDADGHWDIAVAHRGSDAVYLLRGDGKGGFQPAKRIAVSGSITAMISGEINRRDGLIDLVLGVSVSGGSRALVYESPTGALSGPPEIFALSQPIASLALGRFDGGAMQDLAIAAGNQLVVVHARDRKLSQGEMADPARVTVQETGFSIKALVAGDFTGTGPAVGALDDEGKIHILEHSIAEESMHGHALDSGTRAMQLSKPGKDGKPVLIAGRVAPSMAHGMAAMRASLENGGAEWTERSTISMPIGFLQSAPQLVAGRISGSRGEDIVVADSGTGHIHVLSAMPGHRGLTAALHGEYAARKPMSLIASMKTSSAPVAILPMRLSQHGLNGLVTLQSGLSEPTVMPQDVPPTNVFTVTNTLDITSVGGTVPVGSLRHAMNDVESASGDNGGGTYEIVFNIPKSDPGYNAATGAFVIKPLSQSVPGALNDFALPPINATVTIDGYTQPGASPNTLATSDNAKLLIQIDGSKATTPGGSGFVPFDDDGSVFRGIAFTGWINPDVTSGSSGETASGAEGIEANGVGDFIEGNFFGVDTTGKAAAPNRIGIFADNGPLFGSAPGNIIGGTTPQARNILSSNDNSGVLFLSTAFEAQLQGNFVGLDITGAAIVSNPQEPDRSNTFDGAGLNGETVTIGGTLPGSANVIAGNGTNIDINDLTEGNQAKDSLVEGNLIGTDATGTKGFANQGYGVSILHNVTSMTIGGTTAAARNVISGNLAGVYVFDNSFNNVLLGNYIGTDLTGTKAVPNMQQGFITGSTESSEPSAGYTTIGGSVAGAGNVISGNIGDGIAIAGTSQSQSYPNPYVGNTILGNKIGSDATGAKALANGGNGISLTTGATNNVIGSSASGSGNIIAFNKKDGVMIDPGTVTGGKGINNNTVANVILSNQGVGVHIKSGSGNRISQNSIYTNGALGIDLGTTGPNVNSSCNSANSGPNNLQNAPVLTSGSGTVYLTATATDPNGNTSEFSNAVKATENGNVLDLRGNLNSTANTTYTVEFFSSLTPDPSGFGQGETYLGSTTVATNSSCTVAVNDPVDTTQADMSVTLTSDTTIFEVGADFGQYYYTGTVINNGSATAHEVVFTDLLPSGMSISRAYCNVASCQSPIVSSIGSCSVSGQTVTCNLGTMAPGATATIMIPVQTNAAGSLVSIAKVSAAEKDPNPANNTANQTENTDYPLPFIDHINPLSSLTLNSGSLPLTVYGTGFLPTSVVTFNGTAVKTTAYLDNQVCGGPYSPAFCAAIEISVPASLLGTAGTETVTVTNPDPGPGGDSNLPTSTTFTLVSSCTYGAEFYGFNPIGAEGDTLIPEQVEVTTNAPTCAWSAKSNASWLVILDNANGTGSGPLDVAVASNAGAARKGTLTVAGQSVEIDQAAGDSTTCSYALNPASAHIPAGGSSATFGVTTAASCSYFVEAFPDDTTQFITIPQSSALLVGNGNPAYTVAANHGAPRTGAIMIGGDVFQINQDAPACYYTLDANSATLPASGGSGTISVTPSKASCAWTAKSSNTSQVTVTSGATGSGNGTVKYNVPANTTGPATPTITIGDSTGYTVYSITQASPYTCTFTISPSPKEVSSSGTSDYFLLTASYSNCKWTATSSDPSALAITGSSSGTGTSAVYYSVAQNTTNASRVLAINAGCQTFTVNQDGTLASTSNPVPAITSLSPSSAAAGSAAFTLTVTGSNFVSGSVVNFNGVARATAFINATTLNASILATDIAKAATVPVTVTNPTPGGGTSIALNFTVTAVSTPAPAITSISPASVTAGSAAFTLTVNGSNFVSGATVNFNGAPKISTFVSATTLTASILASDVITAGPAAVTVANPAPSGGTSNAVPFTITAASNPLPAITSLSPATTAAGSAAFTLTVTGSKFVSGSVVNFNGVARATTFINATSLTASILASDVATAGTPKVTVANPTPGGGISNALTFTVSAANNPVPAIATLSPAKIAAGSAAFTLTVNGTNFVGSSVVNFNGTAHATTFVSANKVTASVLASDVAKSGTPNVTVTNPTPGGGTSNALTFTISAANNPVPAITTLQPASVIAGSGALTLTVNGSNFVANSVVNFGGSARTTTFVSATQVTAALPASDIAAAGSPIITVTNGSPGGGTSNGVAFHVDNPAPAITALQPQSATAGAAPFTLTITGSGFNAGSIVQFNGGAKATTFVSATSLTAAIAAADVATAGSVPVTVTNPTPGGGTSSAVNFTIATAGTPTVSLTPASITFADTLVGASSPAQNVTLKNTGSAALKITSVAIAGTNAADFSETNGCAGSLAAGASCSITIAFTPAAGGSFAATLNVTDNASGSPQSVALSGNGITPTIPVVSITPASLTFATVTGTTSAAQVVTVKNTGSADLAIAGISVGGTNASVFSETNQCTGTLAAGASCTISAKFSPTSVATFSATLLIADNASGSPHLVSLSGTGTVAPGFTVTSTTTAQTIFSGGAAQYSITVGAQNGAFTTPVTLSATGLPAGATATFLPASVTPGSASATSQLTIQTSVNKVTAGLDGNRTWPILASALPMLWLMLCTRKLRKRWVTVCLMLAASLAAIGTFSGCGGGFILPGTKPQTYAITVTGASGADSRSTTVQLTVR